MSDKSDKKTCGKSILFIMIVLIIACVNYFTDFILHQIGKIPEGLTFKK